jgi:hypothetical protein
VVLGVLLGEGLSELLGGGVGRFLF